MLNFLGGFNFKIPNKETEIYKFRIKDSIDWFTAYEMLVLQEYSLNGLGRCEELMDYYRDQLMDGYVPLILDCGANIGLASKFFSDQYPLAKIIGVEPDQQNFKLATNNSGNVAELYPYAIGSENGFGELIDPLLGGNAFRVSAADSGNVEIISISSLIKITQDSKLKPFIVKIDIEGYEGELFSKNVEWIDEFPLLMIELHDWMLPKQGTSKNFLSEIAKRDRDFILVGSTVFSISNNL